MYIIPYYCFSGHHVHTPRSRLLLYCSTANRVITRPVVFRRNSVVHTNSLLCLATDPRNRRALSAPSESTALRCHHRLPPANSPKSFATHRRHHLPPVSSPTSFAAHRRRLLQLLDSPARFLALHPLASPQIHARLPQNPLPYTTVAAYPCELPQILRRKPPSMPISARFPQKKTPIKKSRRHLRLRLLLCYLLRSIPCSTPTCLPQIHPCLPQNPLPYTATATTAYTFVFSCAASYTFGKHHIYRRIVAPRWT